MPFHSSSSEPTYHYSPLGAIGKRALISLLMVLICLVIGEILVRVLVQAGPPLYQRDPLLGGIYTPGLDQLVYDEETGREVQLRINEFGFRGPDRPLEKPPGRARIAVMGDSMIAGTAFEEELTAVALLEGELRRSHPEVDWEVMNFAIGGGSLGRILVHYREVVRRFEPDYLLVGLFNGNDLVDNDPRFNNEGTTICFDLDESGELYELPFPSWRFRMSGWLNRYSHFYRWQKGSMWRRPLNLKPEIWKVDPGHMIYAEEPDVATEHVWTLIDKLSATLAAEVAADGGQLILFSVPFSLEVYDDLWAQLEILLPASPGGYSPGHPERRLKAMCARLGIAFHSPLANLRAAAPSAKATLVEEQLYINGVGHFTAAGHLVLAHSLHRALVGDGEEPALLEEAR